MILSFLLSLKATDMWLSCLVSSLGRGHLVKFLHKIAVEWDQWDRFKPNQRSARLISLLIVRVVVISLAVLHYFSSKDAFNVEHVFGNYKNPLDSDQIVFIFFSSSST